MSILVQRSVNASSCSPYLKQALANWRLLPLDQLFYWPGPGQAVSYGLLYYEAFTFLNGNMPADTIADSRLFYLWPQTGLRPEFLAL
jgi:hypothetical protein